MHLRVDSLAAPIAIIEILMRHRFPHWQDFIHGWTNHAHFMLLFIYGYLLFASSHLQHAVWQNRRRGLWLGVGGTAVTSLPLLFSKMACLIRQQKSQPTLCKWRLGV